ncbi:dol-P-Man:Man(5)GlcNAc(2)-PP-Dol alpha-1,3-mannosyltransferase isoform X3 [Carex littledalei]|uniref:dolichyl-P-Man:Man5GlcNAc2-PP-dolichol alpha-1,3-mannosyltransferase n=1 Tax=Carex littledalei TaxID=544730 RepID=A0A833VHJ4_9POAL|nr:dol-P-Man:Man(5)GlcNAc(2)-PP-Dol alpha-1,3-mannosyltransferase isoform X3 [Carex littledalei]
MGRNPFRSVKTLIDRFRNPKSNFAALLLCLDAILVDGFLSGERDYSKLKGDTGPLVYPAGFLYVYSLVKFVTGGHVFPAQILFGVMYIINLALVQFIYLKTDVVLLSQRKKCTSKEGNHAQGVALSARELNCDAVIVMPVTTPEIKWQSVERLGATVVLKGDSYDEAQAYAKLRGEQEGSHIHSSI